ncbi:uncharacterized protein LOC144435545 [Glandiceps talaboti]
MDEHFPTLSDISQVLAVFPEAPLAAVRRDLIRTRNVETTINNVLDGILDLSELEETNIGLDHSIENLRETEGLPRMADNRTEDLSSTDENSDMDLPAVDFTSSQRNDTVRSREMDNNHDNDVIAVGISNNTEGLTVSDDCSQEGKSGEFTSNHKSFEMNNIERNINRKHTVQSKSWSISSSDEDCVGVSDLKLNAKINGNKSGKQTMETNRRKREVKKKHGLYSTWSISGSDEDSHANLACTMASSVSITSANVTETSKQSGSSTLIDKNNKSIFHHSISSSSEDEERMPLSLTSRLKQRFCHSSKSNDSQTSSHLGSQVSTNSERQTGYHGYSDSDTSRVGVMKRRNLDDREIVYKDSDGNSIDINDDTPLPVRKKTRRSPEQIAEAKRKALLLRAEREKEKEWKQRLKDETKSLKEREKMNKLKEREEKRLEKERELMKKKTERQALKAARPEECIKYVTTVLDQKLVESPCGAEIMVHLQTKNIRYCLAMQCIDNAVTWQRERPQLESQDSQSLSTSGTYIHNEAEILVVIQSEQFVEMVYAYKEAQLGHLLNTNTLQSYVLTIKDTSIGQNPTLVVIGMEKYFRTQKNKQNKNFRSAVLGSHGDSDEGKKGKGKQKSSVTISISRVDMEEALVDLQLHTNCTVHLKETVADVAALIAMFTKAIAEAPFKRERDKGLFSFHVSTDWAGGVKVDKDGKGLLKVWRQQLQQFRNVSMEVASAIISAYPSPKMLIQAYNQCSSEQQAQKLLQDIVVRRGAGVLATNRRVGPELSRRIHLFMTSSDGDLILHTR